MNKFQKMIVAYKNGIVRPYGAMKVSEQTGLPYAALCAVLEKESYGGKNIFGHDPTIFVGAGKVTKEKYLAYRAKRRAGEGMQGVGPMQLTWWEFQDRADALGGCWKPDINMLVGAQLLKSYWDASHDWITVGTRYNGATEYGIDLKLKIRAWEGRFK